MVDEAMTYTLQLDPRAEAMKDAVICEKLLCVQ